MAPVHRTCTLCLTVYIFHLERDRVWWPRSCLAQRSTHLRPSRRMLLRDHQPCEHCLELLRNADSWMLPQTSEIRICIFNKTPRWCEFILKLEEPWSSRQLPPWTPTRQKGLSIQSSFYSSVYPEWEWWHESLEFCLPENILCASMELPEKTSQYFGLKMEDAF